MATMEELAEAMKHLVECEQQLADATEVRDQLIVTLLDQGERAMNLAIESGLTPARIYQIAKREEQADPV